MLPKLTKICYTCKKLKRLDEYSTNKANKDGHAGKCLTCTRKYANEYGRKTRDSKPRKGVKRPVAKEMSLQEFIEYRERKNSVQRRIIELTALLGKLASRLRGTNVPENIKEIAKEHMEKSKLREELRAELKRFYTESPIPETFYTPHVVEPNGTKHGFRKLKTLSTACTQRNKLIAVLEVDHEDERYVKIKHTQFQASASQKMCNKRLAAINTKC